MSDQAEKGISPLSGGQVEVPTQVPTQSEPVVQLSGGRKTRSDKGKSRRKYRHPTTKFINELARLEYTPGGLGVQAESGKKRCRRGHSYSREFGTCVSHSNGKRRGIKSYRRHKRRVERMKERSGYSRTKSRSRSRSSSSRSM